MNRDTPEDHVRATPEDALGGRVRRRQLLVGWEALVEGVSAILFTHDPVGIAFETNTDEYDPEAESIVARLDEATSVRELRRICHEEFVRWFSADIAGPAERFEPLAQEVWELTQRGGPVDPRGEAT